MPDASDYFEVVWPLSKKDAVAIDEVNPIGGLNGKRIAFVWDYIFKGAEMFEIVKEKLSRRYPTVEFVGYENFPAIQGDEPALIRDLGNKLHDLNVDGVVLGVGA